MVPWDRVGGCLGRRVGGMGFWGNDVGELTFTVMVGAWYCDFSGGLFLTGM